MIEERWVVHPVYKEYEISDRCRVRRVIPYRSTEVGRVLKGGFDRDGYRKFALSINSRYVYKRGHNLVLEAFVGLAPSGYVGCHNDGDVKNNKLENLRWDTMRGNHRDKQIHGTQCRGKTHGKSKLKEDQVAEIKKLLGWGLLTHSEIAVLYSVHRTAITSIRRGVTWAHVR